MAVTLQTVPLTIPSSSIQYNAFTKAHTASSPSRLHPAIDGPLGDPVEGAQAAGLLGETAQAPDAKAVDLQGQCWLTDG